MPRGSLRGYLGHGCFPLIFGNSTSLDKGGLSINLASVTLEQEEAAGAIRATALHEAYSLKLLLLCCCLRIISHPGLSTQYLLLSQPLRTNPTLDSADFRGHRQTYLEKVYQME